MNESITIAKYVTHKLDVPLSYRIILDNYDIDNLVRNSYSDWYMCLISMYTQDTSKL